MFASQNARFSGEVEVDPDFDHPLGASLARLLQAELPRRDVRVDGFDNWRDVGWALPVVVDQDSFQIAFSVVERDWVLQIAPEPPSSFFRRTTRERRHRLATRCHVIATAVAAILRARGFVDIRWKLNGLPDQTSATVPIPPDEV